MMREQPIGNRIEHDFVLRVPDDWKEDIKLFIGASQLPDEIRQVFIHALNDACNATTDDTTDTTVVLGYNFMDSLLSKLYQNHQINKALQFRGKIKARERLLQSTNDISISEVEKEILHVFETIHNYISEKVKKSNTTSN